MAKKQTKKDNQRDAQTAMKIAKKALPKSQVKKAVRKSGFHRAVPYILILLGAVLAAIFFIVRFLGYEDGTGSVGYAVHTFFCGIFGGAAFLLPLALCYVGVIRCVLHFKESSPNANDDEYAKELRRTRRRTNSKTALCFSFILLFSILLGVFADYDSVDISGFYTDGSEEFAVGGIVGSLIGYLLNNALETFISAMILIIALSVVLLFMLGITPDYIITRIRCRRELRDDDVEIDEEQSQRDYERMRQKELERAKKKKLKELEARRKRELAKELADEEIEAYIPPIEPKKKTVKNERPSELDVDSFVDGLEEKEEIKEFCNIEPVPVEPEAITDKKSSNFNEYGGDPVIDGAETFTVEELLSQTEAVSPVTVSEEIKTVNAEVKSEEPALELGEISNETLAEDLAGVAPEEGKVEEEMITPYVFPPIDMLSPNKNPTNTDVTAELQENARLLKETLKSFKVDIKEINYSRGPTITRYELKPEVGTRVRSIANLVDDIALSLATSGVRIEAPIPNKAAVGIEVPNRTRATVYLRDLIENIKFSDAKSRLTSCLGMDVGGNPVYFDVGKMPHLLIAGTTGSGKSVCINTIILSILYKARPDEVKLILIDPKQVEFTVYEDIPHLYCPIVSEPKKAAGALASAVSEMERRFELIKEVGVRNIEAYNEVTANDPAKEYMPKMVIIIDELADLMMTARDEVETSICRLAQKARAAGIHVILGTQRPSVDVITGLIKANVPSRIACTVTSQVDSRTIIDVAGAENLIGYGDMLFAPVGSSKPMRVQGAFVSDGEVENIVTFIKENNTGAKYNREFMESMEENTKLLSAGKKGSGASSDSDGGDFSGGDNKFADAVKLAIESGKISTSLMQRKLKIGYGRAAKIIDQMEELGYVGPADGAKPRAVLITMEQYLSCLSDGTLGQEE